MAWDYFVHTNVRPDFIDYIGGRDIWNFSKKGTDEFSTGLFQLALKLSREDDDESYRIKFMRVSEANGCDAERIEIY